MRSALNAALALALTACAFLPLGPHVLTHALEIGHQHVHADVAHDHDGDHHQHELPPSPDDARIAASGVRLPAVNFSSIPLAFPSLAGESAAATAILARSLDPPRSSPFSQFAARCSGNRAPPSA